jgi:hypothetical protein
MATETQRTQRRRYLGIFLCALCVSVAIPSSGQAPASTIRVGFLQRNGQYRVETIGLED